MRKACLIVASVLSGAVLPASAGTLNVPGQYPDIQSAINAANTGDTIFVSPGTYSQTLNFNNKGVSVVSLAGPATASINDSSGTAVIMGANAQLIGFTINGTTNTAGISVSGGGQLIKNDIFQNLNYAISGNNASPTILANRFQNTSPGSQLTNGTVTFVNGSSPTIENNVFYNNSGNALALVLPAGNSPVVINNTFAQNTVAIEVDNQVSESSQIFRNNILSGNGTGLEDLYNSSSNPVPVWQSNLLYSNTTNYSGIADQTGIAGNLIGNPLFESMTDFHLTPGSAALGIGSPTLAPSVDFDGNPRYFPNIDAGAYQHSVPEPGLLAPVAMGLLALARFRRGAPRR